MSVTASGVLCKLNPASCVWERVSVLLQAVAFKHSSKHHKSRQIVAFALLSVAMCLSSHSDSLQPDAGGAMSVCKKVWALCLLAGVHIDFSCKLTWNLKSSQTEQQHKTSRTHNRAKDFKPRTRERPRHLSPCLFEDKRRGKKMRKCRNGYIHRGFTSHVSSLVQLKTKDNMGQYKKNNFFSLICVGLFWNSFVNLRLWSLSSSVSR